MVFSRVMQEVLQGLTWSSCCVYIDDIICFNKTFQDHLQGLSQIFDRLRKANLTLKPSKCTFAAREIRYLGNTISRSGVGVNKDKIWVVETFPRPKNQHDVRSFLGLTNYFRRFVKNYSTIAAPLNGLLSKDIPFKWSPKCENAFISLKKALTTAPILAFPNFSKEFEVFSDASGTAKGHVLCQRDDQNRQRVIAYGGRALRPAELKWPITHREALSLIEAIKLWHVFLVDKPFKAYVDHASLRFIPNNKDIKGRLARWAILLSSYHFEIIHTPGKN
jgi:hypothetical protein